VPRYGIAQSTLAAPLLGTVSASTRMEKEEFQMLLLILLIILLLAAVPAWPYSRGWGYYPSGGLGTVLLILIILMMLGAVHF
jgi:hypothetical protein